MRSVTVWRPFEEKPIAHTARDKMSLTPLLYEWTLSYTGCHILLTPSEVTVQDCIITNNFSSQEAAAPEISLINVLQ